MPRTLPYYVVDAFTTRPFAGNPAAVIPLAGWLPDELLQQIAGELALSETAFVVREADGLRLRWLTPTTEVDLCGHATLASALVWMDEVEPGTTRVRFATRSGPLEVERDGERLVLDLPARVAEPVADPALVAAVAEAIGAPVVELWRSRNLMAVVADAAAVRALAPELRRVGALPTEGLIVTAPGAGDRDGDVDLVSRYFTPQHGVDEDPVTGSAHCTLGPYWAARLGRTTLAARQVSRRGGEVAVTVAGDRVRLGGHGVLVARGELRLP